MKKQPSKASIPKFGLYGESLTSEGPGFVHIEDIAARSQRNNWVIKPHRHGGLFQVLFMFGGSFQVQIDADRYDLKGCWAVTLPPGIVHGFHFPINAEGTVLTLAEPLLNSTSMSNRETSFSQLLSSAMHITFDSETLIWQQLRGYLELIQQELQSSGTGKSHVLEWLAKIVLTVLARQLKQQQLQATLGSSNLKQLNHFRTLLEEHYRHHWSVRDYANALHVSTSSLNRLCNETQGVPAKALIQDRLLTEAKRLLIYTRMTLEQVAFNLGFKDPAYFSRFFRNLTSTSPSDYRNANNYGTQPV